MNFKLKFSMIGNAKFKTIGHSNVMISNEFSPFTQFVANRVIRNFL